MTKARSKEASYFPKTASVSQLQRNYMIVLDAAQSSSEPVYLLKNNTPAGVLLSVDTYNKMRDIIREYEEKEVDEMLKVYENEKATNKLKPLDSLDELFN